jgi:hypothetical protein
MKARLRLAARGLALLVVWGAAVYAAHCSAVHLAEHNRVAHAVARLSDDYNRSVSDYAGLLVQGQKITSDPDYQVELLKRRFGYARPNETPIVVQIEDRP